jgi:hypothetical protein
LPVVSCFNHLRPPGQTSFSWYSATTSRCGTQTTLIPARLPASTQATLSSNTKRSLGKIGLLFEAEFRDCNATRYMSGAGCPPDTAAHTRSGYR